MNSRRWLAAMLLAAGSFTALAPVAEGWSRHGPTVGGTYVPGWWYGPGGSYGPPLSHPYYQAYIMPLPAYGIMPPPLAEYNLRQGAEPPRRVRPSIDAPAPYEKPKSEVRVEDLRRARFDITLPFENSVVYFDGVKTTQTGLQRVYRTPPLQEDKQYVLTIKVEFTDKAGDPRVRERAFTVVAGQVVSHTFVE